MKPAVSGFRWVPSIRFTRPSTTSTSRLQASGQSSTQAVSTVSRISRSGARLDAIFDAIFDAISGESAGPAMGAVP